MFVVFKQFRLSVTSVEFDFSASLNDVTPVSLMWLPVYVTRKENSELLLDVICVFLLSSLLRLSWVSVVFDLSNPLSDVAPVSPISLPVDVKRKEKSGLLMDVICVSSFFCFHSRD